MKRIEALRAKPITSTLATDALLEVKNRTENKKKKETERASNLATLNNLVAS